MRLIASCLDRFLVSELILTGEGELGAFVRPRAVSNHWSIFLEWTRLGEFVKRPFRFHNFWMTHLEFRKLLKQWWKEYVEPKGSRMYALQQKLKHIKDFLKKWNKESFRNILVKKHRLESQIGEIQSKLMKEGYNEEERTKKKGLIKELAQREKQEEILWQQKSKQMWLKEGDRNMGFFHRSTI